MFGLAHASVEWIIAGGVVFIGLMAVVIRSPLLIAILTSTPHLASSLFVWVLVYSLHGGDAAVGIMTATFAALLFDLIGVPIVKAIRWFKK